MSDIKLACFQYTCFSNRGVGSVHHMIIVVFCVHGLFTGYWMKRECVAFEGDLGPVTHSSDAKVQSHECARVRVHFTALGTADYNIAS